MFFFDLRCLFQSFQQILSSLTNFILAIRILSKTRCFKNLSNRNQEQKGLTHIALLLSFDQNKFFFFKEQYSFTYNVFYDNFDDFYEKNSFRFDLCLLSSFFQKTIQFDLCDSFFEGILNGVNI